MRTSATPVGVASSTATSTPTTGRPTSRRAVAGAGTGRCPWAGADRAVAGGDRRARRPRRRRAPRGRRRRRRRRRWRRGHRPRGSGRRRPAIAVQRPLDLGEGGEGGVGPGVDPRRQGGARRAACGWSAQVRWWWPSPGVCDHGPGGGDAAAEHGLGVERPPVDRRAGREDARTSSRSAPASSSAPSSMSPATPEKQCTRTSRSSSPRHLSSRSTAQAAP